MDLINYTKKSLSLITCTPRVTKLAGARRYHYEIDNRSHTRSIIRELHHRINHDVKWRNEDDVA